jgi:hypothetical protein
MISGGAVIRRTSPRAGTGRGTEALGGRSAVNFEIDAGVIYSYTNDWWTNFILRQGDAFCFNNSCDPGGPFNRTTPGFTSFEFWVPQDGEVALFSFEDSSADQYTIVVGGATGWVIDGYGQRLKWTTSLTNASTNDNVPEIYSRGYIGVFPEIHRRRAEDIAESGGYCSSGNVTVDWVDPAEETVTLHYP